MDSNQLNRWLTLGANIGVLVGIILLVMELNQNREMARAQTRNELSMGIVGIQSGVAENSELASVLAKARAGETLSPSEQIQYSNRELAMFRYWENVHYQYRVGLYDDDEYSKQKYAWDLYLNGSEATAKTWCLVRDMFSSKFSAEVDDLLSRFTC